MCRLKSKFDSYVSAYGCRDSLQSLEALVFYYLLLFSNVACFGKLYIYLFFFYKLPGASSQVGQHIGAVSVPVFLSSLRCTDEDHSLLDNCAHSQLGLAVCDEDSGLAGAKCFGEECSSFTGV